MIVKELIELLQTMPQDAEVLYTFCSDNTPLEGSQITLYRKDGSVHGRDGELFHKQSPHRPTRWVVRDGRIHEYVANQWPADWTPQFIDVVLFPGN